LPKCKQTVNDLSILDASICHGEFFREWPEELVMSFHGHKNGEKKSSSLALKKLDIGSKFATV
jgi:hypothetical protein